MCFSRPALAVMLIIVAGSFPSQGTLASESGGLSSLAQAEAAALERDAGLERLRARQSAFHERAVAAGQLPDPRLRVGAVNVPVDSFDLDQEAMTQVVVGLRQELPLPESRRLKSATSAALGDLQDSMILDRKRQVLREVRTLWVAYAEATQAQAVVAVRKEWFAELERAVTASYASGRRSQHDVIRARLEQELLEEKLIGLGGEAEAQAAGLERWAGARPLAGLQVPIPKMLTSMEYRNSIDGLATHPVLETRKQWVAVGELQAALAEEQYKPRFAVDVSYGFRDGSQPNGHNRSDFVSAMLSFSLPVFTGKRQDRELAAARAEVRSLRKEFEDQEQSLRGQLDGLWAELRELQQRENAFRDKVLPTARLNVEATLSAYQNDLASFDELVKAQDLLLNQELMHLRILASLARKQIGLAYLSGDTK